MVFVVAILQYSNTANHDYAWDDAIVLTENTRVQKGLSDIPELFENIKTNETQNRYGYRPISLLSFATDVQLFGMNPAASHRVSILYYAILCALVLLFLETLFPNAGLANLLVALLFVVHPLHTEVVANIKSRDEVLAMLFGLGSLLVYRNGLVSNNRLLFVLSGLLMLLGFLSKESAITFCGVAFILPWFVSESIGTKEYLKKCIPAFMIVVLLIASRLFVYSDVFFQSNDFDLYLKGMFHHDGFIGNPLFDADGAQRLATAAFLIGYFLYRFIVPYPLVHDYSYNQFPVMNWSNFEVWISLLAVVAILILLARNLGKRSPLAFGISFFFITSSIYLHLVQIAPDIFAERFLFVPSLGLCIALLSLFELKAIKPQVIYVTLAIALIPIFTYSRSRNLVWKDNDTLLKSDLPRLKNCVRANYNMALYVHNEYYSAPEQEKARLAEEALGYYEHVLSLTDRLFNVYMDLGAAYMEFGYPDKGKMVFQSAIEKYPDLSLPYVQMGKYHMSFNRYDKAIPFFQRALQNGSQNSDFHYLLSICLFNTGQHDNAITTLLEGEKLGVSSSSYYDLMARLYSNLLDYQKAKEALIRGLQKYPQDQGLLLRLEEVRQAESI